jgi:hypothetical protein
VFDASIFFSSLAFFLQLGVKNPPGSGFLLLVVAKRDFLHKIRVRVHNIGQRPPFSLLFPAVSATWGGGPSNPTSLTAS